MSGRTNKLEALECVSFPKCAVKEALVHATITPVNLTDGQKELLRILVSEGAAEFIIVRSHGSSGLVYPGSHGKQTQLGPSSFTDAIHLAHEGFIVISRRTANTLSGSLTQRGIEAVQPEPTGPETDQAKAQKGSDPGPGRLFQLRGQVWNICFEGVTIQLPDSKGLKYLSYLLASPGHEVSALTLYDSMQGSAQIQPRSSSGDVIDEKALRQYKERIKEIETEIDDAQTCGHEERVELLKEELDALAHEVSAATGLRGRRRTVGDTNERARKAVAEAIKRTINEIRRHHVPLAEHLDKRITKGNFLSYAGDAVRWIT